MKFLLMLGLLPVVLFANAPSKSEFAYGFPIEFSAGNSVYDVDLPREVYQNSSSPELNDLRVFNSEEEVVPHQVLTFQQMGTESELAPPVAMKLFPIEGISSKEVESLRIHKAKDGSVVIAGQKDTSGTKETKKSVRAYIIDASGLQHGLESLIIQVRPDKNYFRKINIEWSSDLKRWASVERGAVLANLAFQGEALSKNKIQIGGRKSPYYRLSWEDGEGPLDIESVTGVFPKVASPGSSPLTWDGFTGEASSKGGTAFIYDLKSFLPVKSVRMKFKQTNSVAKIVIESRNSEEEGWTERARKTLYWISREGRELVENQVSFSPRRFRFWRFRVLSSLDAVGSAVPEVDFGWVAEKVRFLGRGNSPFTLAFGNAFELPVRTTMDLTAAQWSSSLGRATLGERIELGGAQRLEGPKPTVNWKKWILWIVLLGGALSMGWIAFRLLKTIKEN